MASNTRNQGGVNGRSLNHPRGLSLAGGRLFVADTSNHRVLVWDEIPASDQARADAAIGQPDLFSNDANAGGRGYGTLYLPRFIYSDGERLFVADTGNDRLLSMPLP